MRMRDRCQSVYQKLPASWKCLLSLSILALVTIPIASGDDVGGNRDRRLKGEWPLPGQNNRYLSQAELPCNMPHAPQEVWSYDLGRTPIGSALCADVDDDGEVEVLYGASPLMCMSLSGKEKWRCSCGGVLAIADIDEDGHTDLVVGGAAGPSSSPAWIRGGKAKKEATAEPAGSRPLQPSSAAATEKFSGNARDPEWSAMSRVVARSQSCCRTSRDFKSPVSRRNLAPTARSLRSGVLPTDVEHGKLVWERPFAVWEHAGSMVGRYADDTICLISPTWGGLIALDVKDGKDLMRLYWEEAPGKSGLRNYGPLFVTQLDGDDKIRIRHPRALDLAAHRCDCTLAWQSR